MTIWLLLCFAARKPPTAGTRARLSIGDFADSCSSKQFSEFLTVIRVMVMQYDDDDRPAKDWILRTDYGLDGDSLSYEDRCFVTMLIISSFHFMAGWRGKSSRRKGELRRGNSWRRDGNDLVVAS